MKQLLHRTVRTKQQLPLPPLLLPEYGVRREKKCGETLNLVWEIMIRQRF